MNVAARLEPHASPIDGNDASHRRAPPLLVTVGRASSDVSAARYQEFALPPRESTQVRPGRQAVEAACAKVLSSRTFRHSARHRALLRHVVKAALEGRAACLKEVAIGLEIFGRVLNGQDRERDSIVRVEARRLRLKLRRYYDSEGCDDALEICLPSGTYAPTFEIRRCDQGPASGEALVLVLPFVACGDGAAPAATSVGLADQLIDVFGSRPGIRVVAPGIATMLSDRSAPFDTLRSVHGIDYVVDGSIVTGGSRMRCVAHLSRTRDSQRLWSCRFDTSRVDSDRSGTAASVEADSFAFQDRIAEQVVAAVARECGAA